jgi:hypothetical protein
MTGIAAQFAQAESINPLANPAAEIRAFLDQSGSYPQELK